METYSQSPDVNRKIVNALEEQIWKPRREYGAGSPSPEEILSQIDSGEAQIEAESIRPGPFDNGPLWSINLHNDDGIHWMGVIEADLVA